MSKPRRITELTLTTTPSISDLLAIARPGSNNRITLGTLINSEFPATFGDTTINGDLDVNGNLRVSKLVSASILYESGSTLFGNSMDDIHRFTGSIYVTGSINDVDSINFDTTHLTPANVEGRLTWNDEDGTLNLGLKGGNVTLQVGQEQVIRVVNKTTADLLESEYKAIRVRAQAGGGAQGQRLAVVIADSSNEINSSTTLGVVTEDIGKNQEGFITTFGLVRGINTTGDLQNEEWLDGDTLYLSPTNPGGLTKVKPMSPDHLVIMGYVIYAHQTAGKIFVKVNNGYEIEELHDVYINTGSLVGNATTTGGSSLYYSGSVWTNNQEVKFTESTAILTSVSESLNFADDSLAAAGGVPLGGLYRNGNVIQIRIV